MREQRFRLPYLPPCVLNDHSVFFPAVILCVLSGVLIVPGLQLSGGNTVNRYVCVCKRVCVCMDTLGLETGRGRGGGWRREEEEHLLT